jgi:hypothetical protein
MNIEKWCEYCENSMKTVQDNLDQQFFDCFCEKFKAKIDRHDIIFSKEKPVSAFLRGREINLYGFELKCEYMSSAPILVTKATYHIITIQMKVPVKHKYILFWTKTTTTWIDIKNVCDFVNAITNYMPERLQELKKIRSS